MLKAIFIETKPRLAAYTTSLNEPMKKLSATFVFAFALLCGVPSFVFAQESNSQEDSTTEAQNDRYQEQDADMELTPSKPTAAKPDSISAKPFPKKAATEAQKAAKKADEDVVSFNFLYYVIQRFKLSDIVKD